MLPQQQQKYTHSDTMFTTDRVQQSCRPNGSWQAFGLMAQSSFRPTTRRRCPCLPSALIHVKSPFKASPALIAQRETQFVSFVTVLLGDGLPPALRRLRADRVVRDFFGQREDDYELAQRLPPSFVRSVPPSCPWRTFWLAYGWSGPSDVASRLSAAVVIHDPVFRLL
jgi:hypothetical protein